MSKITAALTSATNEFTVAAANLNFDFSLVKLEAPKEFSAIGPSLSQQRRENAEGGPYHVTARKLGALFEGLMPSVPQLIRAYGSRASEISASPIANPKGSTADGFFASQVGLDGTGLWAAATSGTAAIGIHLLACMLARIWTTPEATSIWVQIVAERKREIEKTLEEQNEVDYRTLSAARQEISRSQLAEWDASARAWLQAADEVHKIRQRQLLLIVNNVHVAVNHKPDMFTSVVYAWRTALQTLDALVQGMPHQVRNGSVLLGLSAWHLYPDMDVLGARPQAIKMNDSLIVSGGCVTIGLQSDSPEKLDGVYWSLSLANFRYYGDAVRSTRSTGSDASRITFDQLWIVTLGSLLQSWKGFDNDYCAGARFIATLWSFLGRAHGQGRDQFAFLSPLRTYPWLRSLSNAAAMVLESDGLEKQTAMMLVGLGRRMGSKFLFFEDKPSIPPAFGLNTVETWVSILSTEGIIGLFRALATKIALGIDSAIIRYSEESLSPVIIPEKVEESEYKRKWTGYRKENRKEKASIRICDYASAVPSPVGRGSDMQHCRWISEGDGEFLDENLQVQIAKLQPGRFESRSKVPAGERFQLRNDPSVPSSIDGDSIIWTPSKDGEPSMYRRILGKADGTSLFLKQEASLTEEQTPEQHLQDQMLRFKSLGSILESFQNIEASEEEGITKPDNHYTAPQNNVSTVPDSWEEVAERPILKNPGVTADLAETSDEKITPRHQKAALGSKFLATTDYIPLYLLHSAGEIYKLLPNATISCSVTTASLMSRSWIKIPAGRLRRDFGNFDFHLDRKESFAALAFFETGRVDLEITEDVMALSYGSSIYVAAPLLCDPCERPLDFEMKRITGNVGRAGIALLVPPKKPRMKEAEPEMWKFVRHAPFAAEPENNFEATSLHLSFTGFEAPLDGGNFGNCDTEVFYLETVVSVYDRGLWVADLNILESLQSELLRSLEISGLGSISEGCGHQANTRLMTKLTSVDNWNEFLDKPENGSVARAHRSWLARLALTSISVQRGDHTMVVPEEICWSCVLKWLTYQPTPVKSFFLMIW